MKMKKIILTSFIVLNLANAHASPIQCPTIFSVKQKNWTVNNLLRSEKFSRKNIFNRSDVLQGQLGSEKKPYPVSLAPDHEEKHKNEIFQFWRFARATSPVLLVCYYRDTNAYLSRELPATVRECKQTLEAVNAESHVPSGVIVKRIECQ